MHHLMKVYIMSKYFLFLFVLCLSHSAYAKSIENAQALSIIYNTTIAGIGLESSIEEIKTALSQYKVPMDCKYKERLSTSKSKINKNKSVFYQDWSCKDIEGAKHKMLDIHAANGAVYSILYRGNVITSLDKADMFAYYRDVDKQLSNTGIEHDDFNFVFTEMGADISPSYQTQRLMLLQNAKCSDGRLVSVKFEGKLTNMPAQNAFTVEVNYQRHCF